MSGPNIIICKLKKVFSKNLALNNDDKKKQINQLFRYCVEL